MADQHGWFLGMMNDGSRWNSASTVRSAAFPSATSPRRKSHRATALRYKLGELHGGQWQAQPPPQQPPPPPENPEDDFANAPFAEPFPALKTESWMALRLLAHFGQLISCCLFRTIFSKCVWQSSQMYS
ncbi:MAG: hypothetical protein AUH13_06210 [Acidobacteria bacterium 13_2_20CM_58_27]|nr:MAG: hypothetical protein AUH13_06210 [Acidobacteria bacterium 13_2_20CM_58_27]